MKNFTDYLFKKIRQEMLPADTQARFDLIVFSHLRWEFVTQRPQHLMTRLARGRTVLFVEEPIPFSDDERGTANVVRAADGVTVIQPRIGHERFGAELERVVKYYQAQLDLQNPVLWFYSAAFLEMIDRLEGYRAIIYDCMDELSQFKGAPQDLRFKEQRLIAMADAVFTGGKSLYEAKKQLKEKSVYCFPSSVDRAHFESALQQSTAVPADIARLARPVVGYYGVIDERIDLDLLERVANAMPDVNFAMIGPVVKISESDLPRRANLHYLGAKKYEELPSYLKGMDIAMMPFAINEATEYISPTKTLEFMAAGKAIVSTPITDVVRDYSETVSIAKNAEQFIRSIRLILAENAFMKKIRQAKQRVVLNRTSWDITAQEMEKIVARAAGRRLAADMQTDLGAAPAVMSPSKF